MTERRAGRRHVATVLVVCAVAGLAYANSFQAGFVADNRALILNDPRVRQATAENLRLIVDHGYWWPTAEHGLYRPLSTLSHLVNYAVLGHADRPAGYHAVNLALHLVNAGLLYALGLRIIRRWLPAAGLAAVWAVHPMLTESVTNIIGRSDELAALGILAGLWCYLHSRDSSGRRRAAWLGGLLLATFLSVFSKESGVALAGVIGVYELVWWTRRRSAGWLAAAAAAMAAPAALMLYQRSIVIGQATAAEFHFVDNPLVDAPFLSGRLTAIRVMALGVWRVIWPATLSNDHSYNQIPLATGGLIDWIGWAMIAALAGAAAWQFRRERVYTFFIMLAFVTLLPSANLLFTTGTIMAERLWYLPSVGILGCGVLIIEAAGAWRGWRWATPVVLAVAVAAAAARTWQRNADWRDELSLWRSAAEASPASYQAHRAYAAALFQSDTGRSNLLAVVEAGERALAILDPLPDRLNATDAYSDIGFHYAQLGESLAGRDATGQLTLTTKEASARAYRRSAEILRRGVAIDRAVGEVYMAQEIARGRSADTIAPVGLPSIYERLALTSVRLGDHERAIEAARHARQLAPQLAEVHEVLVWVLTTAGRREDAAVALIADLLMNQRTKNIGQVRALYAGGLDAEGCAIIVATQGATLNQACPIVRAHLCRASADLVAIYRWNRRPDLVDDAARRAQGAWQCAPAGSGR